MSKDKTMCAAVACILKRCMGRLLGTEALTTLLGGLGSRVCWTITPCVYPLVVRLGDPYAFDRIGMTKLCCTGSRQGIPWLDGVCAMSVVRYLQ